MSKNDRCETELAKENPPEDEQVHIDNLIDRLRRLMEKENPSGQMHRDAHSKMHGCVKGELIVEPNLPAKFQIGIFQEARSFPAWIRFSNADGKQLPDARKDLRGIAIKLMGVDGPKLLKNEEQGTTLDLVMLSHNSFLTKNVAEFDAFTKAVVGGVWHLLWFFFNPFNSHFRVLGKILTVFKRFANPLEIQYFSLTPYLLGSQAVKYTLKPVGAIDSEIPKNPSNDYLRDAMVRQLHDREASFDLMVQVQTDPKKMPIEDVSVAWDEALAPFHKVATVRIPAQEFDSLEQREFGEHLSYNPFRTLAQHRPLGGINRARSQVYQALSIFRHERNNMPREEPSADDAFFSATKTS